MKYLGALLLLIAVAFPIVAARDLVTAAYFTILYITLAVNYDLLGGHLGYNNLGQGAFFGSAAYVTMLLVKSTIFAGLGAAEVLVIALVAVMCVGAMAYFFAYILFRLRGAYFAMATFAMVILIQQVITNLPDLTGGFYGIYIDPDHFLKLQAAYYIMLAVLVGSMAINAATAGGRLGMAAAAICDSETAAAAIGIRVFRVKQVLLVLSAVPSACAGVVFALQAGYIDVSSAMGPDKTLLPVIMAMMGGSGLLAGPIVGGILVRSFDIVLKNILHLTFPAMAVYGVILLSVGLLMPRGVLNFNFRGKRPALYPDPTTQTLTEKSHGQSTLYKS